jgi:iron complex outermembrane receptor protein
MSTPITLLPVAIVLAAAAASLPGVGAAQTADGQQPQREEIVVIGRTPLPGSDIDIGKVPGSVQTLSAKEIDQNKSVSILDSLSQRIPGLVLNDSQGNGTFADVHYRGFAASPLQGTPEGIAVYQNGVRLNEAFGDTVNWDLIPEVAIDRLAITSNNPAFGLNAIGGALSIAMKNGFTFQGLEAEIEGGSYGHINGSIEYGANWGDWSFYAAAEAFKDDGYRLFSNSDIERLYTDTGYKGDISEFHLIVEYGRSSLGVVGSTPLDIAVRHGISAVYTSPQTTRNEDGLIQLNGTTSLSDTLSVQTNLYGRYLGQKHVDGNDSDFEECGGDTSSPGKLCLDSGGFGQGGSQAFFNRFVIRNAAGQAIPFVDTPYGTIDRTSTNTATVGGAVQATYDAPVFGHGSNLVVGFSFDHSDIRFASNSTLGYIDPALQVGLNPNVPGTGQIIHTTGSVGYAPVALDAATGYYGIYGAETFDITPRLSATVGLRINVIDIDTHDNTGSAPELNGDNTYTHASPQAGLTYKIGDGVTAYAGYSQANRAPTPLELDCASRTKPCLLENSLVSDPPLKQVVADNYEAGLRGAEDTGMGQLTWSAGYYRNESSDDIVALASTISGRGYYTNVPETLRQGAEVGGAWHWGQLTAYANYSYVDATYRFNGTLSSANNPHANGAGNIRVHSGDMIPGIPNHQFKIGADYQVTPAWSVGGDAEYVGGQNLVGDDSNQNPRLTPYFLANIRGAYQIDDNVQIFGRISNLFDRRYASFGTYFETSGVGQPITDNLNDPRSITLGQPRSFFGGVKLTF